MTVGSDIREHWISSIIYLICLVLTCVFCGYQIYLHLKNKSIDPIQKQICRILFIFPLFAVCSAMGIIFIDYEELVNIVRDLITFYGLYAFLELIIAYMSLESKNGEWVFDEEDFYHHLTHEKQTLKHLPVVRCWFGAVDIRSPIHAGVYMYKMRLMILQGCIVKPFFSLLLLIVEDQDSALIDIIDTSKVITLVSTLLTLYYILFIYQNFKTELAYTDPHGKFLAIKFGFFLATVQTILLEFASSAIDKDLNLVGEEGVYAINNWLIAAENLVIGLYACKVYGFHNFEHTLDHKSKHDPLMKEKRTEMTKKTTQDDEP
mmetsp:Transcript_2876/g.3052  ORF Transcript_2876/g.3052 Transcript_2876/m.3052 type:complete len:319 (-) Transcript_2876:158-1114(-)